MYAIRKSREGNKKGRPKENDAPYYKRISKKAKEIQARIQRGEVDAYIEKQEKETLAMLLPRKNPEQHNKKRD